MLGFGPRGFSCHSLFHLFSFLSLLINLSPTIVDPIFYSLWKIKIPKKVMIFVWQILHGESIDLIPFFL